MNIDQEITKLTDKYYRLISPQNHKDRDCHWSISLTWSYGQPPVFSVEHYGYLYEDIRDGVECKTLEEAKEKLLGHIKEAIEKEIKWAQRVVDEPAERDFVNLEIAKEVLKIAEDNK